MPGQKKPTTIKPGDFKTLQDAKDYIKNNPNLEWDMWDDYKLHPTELVKRANEVLSLVERLQTLNPNLKIDITRAHTGAIIEGFGQLEKLAKEWPEVMARLELITTYEKMGSYDWSEKQNTFAHATRDGKTIGLNPKYWSNPTVYITAHNQLSTLKRTLQLTRLPLQLYQKHTGPYNCVQMKL